jgi:hypothetical protein
VAWRPLPASTPADLDRSAPTRDGLKRKLSGPSARQREVLHHSWWSGKLRAERVYGSY